MDVDAALGLHEVWFRGVLRHFSQDVQVRPPHVNDRGILMLDTVAIGGVAIVERPGPEIVLVRKARQDGYEFSGLWSLPGGLARGREQYGAVSIAAAYTLLEASLRARLRAETGLAVQPADIRPVRESQARPTIYTRHRASRRVLVIPFRAAAASTFVPESADASVTEAQWWPVRLVAGLPTPATCLIIADVYPQIIQQDESGAWKSAVAAATQSLRVAQKR